VHHGAGDERLPRSFRPSPHQFVLATVWHESHRPLSKRAADGHSVDGWRPLGRSVAFGDTSRGRPALADILRPRPWRLPLPTKAPEVTRLAEDADPGIGQLRTIRR